MFAEVFLYADFSFKSFKLHDGYVSTNTKTIKLLLIIVKAISTKRIWQTPTKYHKSTTAKIHEKVSHRRVYPETKKNF